MTAAHARVLAPDLAGAALAGLVGLAFAGTFVVYGLDRLRDVERDRAYWPDRTAFAMRHARPLEAGVAVAAIAAAACVATQPLEVWLVCGAIAPLGLGHRRLKTRAGLKLVYLTLAWWAVTVGLPWIRGDGTTPFATSIPVATASALALAANMVASNPALRAMRAPVARRWTLVLAAAGVACAWAAAGPGRAIAWIPAAQLVALVPDRHGERHRLWAVDGSLAAGATLVLGWLAGMARP